jgi:aromatic ring hydroxylase
MIRTGTQYLESIRDSREVYMDGERVADLATHPMFKPAAGNLLAHRRCSSSDD